MQTTHMNFLQNLANTENVAGEIQAQILLEEANEIDFLETIKLPVEPMNNKNMAFESNTNEQHGDYNNIINVFPNPAKDYISIEYALLDFCNNAYITIYDAKGSIIERAKIKHAIGSFKNTIPLSKGNYIVKVGNNFSQSVSIL
jgi:hypothetical protein